MEFAVIEIDKEFNTNRATAFATQPEADAYCEDLMVAYQFTDGESATIFVCSIEEPMDRAALGNLVQQLRNKREASQ